MTNSINLNWANEQNPHGYTKEQIEAARTEQTAQQRQALQRAAAEIPALRAQAEAMLAVEKTGPAFAEISNALTWLNPATVGQFKQVLETWAYAVQLTRNTEAMLAPAQAAQARQRMAEAQRPRPLSIEERIARIERHLGLE